MTEIKQPGYMQTGWFQTHPTEAPQGELASLHESLKPADIREGWQQEPVFRMRAQAAPLPAVQQGDAEVLLIAAVDEWFAKNTGLGGCSDKDVQELQAIFAAHAPTDSQPALPKITAEDRSLLHYNPNTDDIVEWVRRYASAAIDADRAMRAQPGAAYAELPALFREALAWGMTYGPEIPAHQWDEMRESMVKHYTDRASRGQAPAVYTQEQIAVIKAAAVEANGEDDQSLFQACLVGLMEGEGASEDHELVKSELAKLPLTAAGVTLVHAALVNSIKALRASRGQAPAPARATADVFGLQWPGENRINLSTVFDTEAEALEYRDNRCDTPGILVVRLSASAYLAAQTAMCDDKEGGAA